MKKLLAILGAATLLFATACDNAATTDPAAPTVDVGTLADLPASGATDTPADAAESLEMVDDVFSSLMDLVQSDSEVMSILPGARATETSTEPVSYVSEDGNIVINGSVTSSTTFPDEDWQPDPNVWYNNIIAMKAKANIDGTLTGATVQGDVYTYDVVGRVGLIEDANVNMDVRINYVQGAEDATVDMNMDMSISLQYGLALSILRDDGVGARFMITFSGSTGFTDLDLEEMDLDMSAVMEDLASKTATLTAYDDVGNVLSTQEIPLTNLPGLKDLMGSSKSAEEIPDAPSSIR